MKFLYSYWAILLFIIVSSKAHTPGTVTVDVFTFDKMLKAFDVTLAKFDDKYRMYLILREKFQIRLEFHFHPRHRWSTEIFCLS